MICKINRNVCFWEKLKIKNKKGLVYKEMIKKFKRIIILWLVVMLNISVMLWWVFCNNEEIRLGRC